MSNTMSESWRDEALMTHPMYNQLRPGESSRVSSVVEAVLRNDEGMAREEISDAVDYALRNEAMDLLNNRRNADEMVEQWDLAAEAAHERGEQDKAEFYEEKRDAAANEANEEYENGRADLAEALNTARRSGKVLMELDTCRAVVELDHDGRLSVLSETDVPALYGVNPQHSPVPAQAHASLRQSRPSAPSAAAGQVDFSREATRPATSKMASRQPQAERQTQVQAQTQRQRQGQVQPAATTSAQRRPAASGPVHVSQPMNDLISRLRRGEPGDPAYRAEAEEQQESSQSEPELG